MKVTIEFDPTRDECDTVVETVRGVYDPSMRAPLEVRIEGQPMFNQAEHVAADMACAVAGTPANPLASPAAPGASSPAPAVGLTAPAQVAPLTSNGVQLDAAGVPWDARIHSSGKDENGQPKKTATGVWAKRRGVSELEVTQVTNELLNMMAASAGTAATALPAGGVLGNPVHVPHQEVVEVAPGQYEVAHVAPVEYAPDYTARNSEQFQQAPLAPPAPLVAPAPLAVAIAPVVPHDFPSLMQYITGHLHTPANPDGKLTQDHIAHICRHFSLLDAAGNPSIGLAQSRPDLVAVLYQSFANQIAAV